MRTLLLSNVTMAPLARLLTGLEVEEGGFGDVIAPLVDPRSTARAAGVACLLWHLDGDELVAASRRADVGREALDALDAYCSARPDVVVVASTVHPDPASPATYSAATDPRSPRQVELRFNARLTELAVAHPNLLVLDVGLVAARAGLDALVAPAFWYAGRIRYTPRMFRGLARHVLGLLGAWRGRSRKVLALDLDGTLWGGVVGEEGPLGVALGEDGVGKCHRDLQHAIAALRDVGVLLVVVSKNNPGDVDAIFAENPMMVLARNDFVAVRANWDDKVTNLRAVAAQLDLGLDSFVFVDDNPVERELVRTHLPEVAVPDFPAKPELFASWFVDEVAFAHFPRARVLDEDRAKTAQYRARAARTEAAEGVDLAGFLASLRIAVRTHVDRPDLVERVSQLTQKTNQFTTTTARLTPAEVGALVASDRHRVVAVEYEDRFGKEGIVGAAVLDLDAGDLPVLLLSCRVLGRGVEAEVLAAVEDLARAGGLERLSGRFTPSARNEPARTLFPDHGYRSTRVVDDGTTVYEKDLR